MQAIPVPTNWRQLDIFMHNDDMRRELNLRAIYRTSGPSFMTAHVFDHQVFTPRTGRNFSMVQAEVMGAVCAEVEAYNAATLPVPNGPDEVVALVETMSRVKDASRSYSLNPWKQSIEDELRAACRANAAAADGAVRYFIQSQINEEET